jgi:chitinase
MTYAMAGAWDGWRSWHSSALDGATPSTPTSVAVSVRSYLAAGVPAAKLGVGIGFFGQCWRPAVTGPGQDLRGSQVVAEDNVMSYTNILASYYDRAAYHWDTQAQVPYLGFATPHGPQGCTLVSYDDGDSVAAKSRYVRANGLGGEIVWTVNQGHLRSDAAGHRDDLLRRARLALAGR